MHLRAGRWLFLFILPFLTAITAQAQFVQGKGKTKVLLNAKFIERDNEKDITILRHDVQVILEQQFISCNEAIIIWARNEIIAVGNVVLRSNKSDVQGEKIIYNFKDQTGKIYDGVVISGQVLLQSDFIEKTGPDTYKAENAYFSTCMTCPASWSFTADKVDATIEGYAYITYPWLNIVEVPFLPIPYLIIPLKNTRQTGILTPSFESVSYGGFGLELPFFWAISRSQDLTFTPKYYDRVGVQALLNYRYRVSELSGGEFYGGFLKDKSQIGNPERWFSIYTHYFELPNDFIQRTSLRLASDTLYTKDFQQDLPLRGEPALENRVSLTKNYDDFHISIDASYYQSLLQLSPSEVRDTSVHRVPELRFSMTDKKILDGPDVFFRFDGQYVNFARQSLGYDSPSTTPFIVNGVSNPLFQPGSPAGFFNPATDKIRTGQRLDIFPYLYSPWRLFNKRIDVTPYLAYRHTQYVLGAMNETANFDSFPHRNYLLTGVKTSTEFSRIFKSAESNYRHSVIPEINFQSIPSFYQTDHSFFGTQDQIPYFLQTQPLQDLDLLAGGRGMQFDYEDRIIGRRLVNLGLTNRLVRKIASPAGNSYDQALLFSLSQAYDMIEEKKTNGRPWQDIRGILDLRWGPFTSFTEAYHFPYHKVTNLNSGIRLNLINTNFFEVSYSNYLNVPLEPVNVNDDLRQESILLTAGTNMTYLSFSGQVEYSLKSPIAGADSTVKRWLAKAEFIPPGKCWTIDTAFFQTLDTNQTGYKAMINFRFGN